MEQSTQILSGSAFILIGVALYLFRVYIGGRAATLYRKLNIDVNDELYAKQFGFIGILMILFGFIVITGLAQFI